MSKNCRSLLAFILIISIILAIIISFSFLLSLFIPLYGTVIVFTFPQKPHISISLTYPLFQKIIVLALLYALNRIIHCLLFPGIFPCHRSSFQRRFSSARIKSLNFRLTTLQTFLNSIQNTLDVTTFSTTFSDLN